MKNLFEYLLTKNKPKLSDKHVSKLETWEEYRYIIPSNIIHQYIIDALEINWLTPDDLLEEYNKFKDDGEYADAYPDNVPIYRKFEDTLSEIIFDSEYSGKEGDILDHVWEKIYEIMTEIKETFENDTNK